MRSTCPAISRHLLFFYGGARRRNNENDNKISWYLRACVDDLRHGIERENLVVKPEKLVQTTGNFDINTKGCSEQKKLGNTVVGCSLLALSAVEIFCEK